MGATRYLTFQEVSPGAAHPCLHCHGSMHTCSSLSTHITMPRLTNKKNKKNSGSIYNYEIQRLQKLIKTLMVRLFFFFTQKWLFILKTTLNVKHTSIHLSQWHESFFPFMELLHSEIRQHLPESGLWGLNLLSAPSSKHWAGLSAYFRLKCLLALSFLW